MLKKYIVILLALSLHSINAMLTTPDKVLHAKIQSYVEGNSRRFSNKKDFFTWVSADLESISKRSEELSSLLLSNSSKDVKIKSEQEIQAIGQAVPVFYNCVIEAASKMQ